jgi:hypothetical protein
VKDEGWRYSVVRSPPVIVEWWGLAAAATAPSALYARVSGGEWRRLEILQT